MMYLVSVKKETSRSEYYDYYIVLGARDEDHACDLVIIQTGEYRNTMTAKPAPPVYKVAKSSMRGVYTPEVS